MAIAPSHHHRLRVRNVNIHARMPQPDGAPAVGRLRVAEGVDQVRFNRARRVDSSPLNIGAAPQLRIMPSEFKHKVTDCCRPKPEDGSDRHHFFQRLRRHLSFVVSDCQDELARAAIGSTYTVAAFCCLRSQPESGRSRRAGSGQLRALAHELAMLEAWGGSLVTPQGVRGMVGRREEGATTGWRATHILERKHRR